MGCGTQTYAAGRLGVTVMLSSFQSCNISLFQKRHPFTGSVKPETPGDRKNACLHWGDFLEPLGIWAIAEAAYEAG